MPFNSQAIPRSSEERSDIKTNGEKLNLISKKGCFRIFLIENSKPLILIASKTCLMSLIKVGTKWPRIYFLRSSLQ